MAPRNKENGGTRPQKIAKRSRQPSFVEPESSEEDYRKKRDKNNQVSRTFDSRSWRVTILNFDKISPIWCLMCDLVIVNPQAVKKSRVKSRQRTQETMERVQKLKTENDMLEEKIKILSKELGFLKDLFLAHAGK